jgi:TP901 family phage tail tape measure protein
MSQRIKDEILKVTVVVNGEEATKELYKLEDVQRALGESNKALRAERAKLEAQGKKDTEAYQQLTAKIKENDLAIRSNDARMKELRKEIGLNALTTGQLKKEAISLRRQLENLTPGSAQFKKLDADLKAVEARMRELKGQSQATGMSLGGIADGFNKYSGIAATVLASTTGLVLGFRKLVDTFNQFEAGVDELSSLTGLAGEDLNWLSEQAKELSVSTVAGGVKITASAQDIVKAYTLMGSAKPELLANKEALNEVTKQALILAEAAKMNAAEAVQSLAETMNQFSAPAEEAGRFINVLAAGSKEGAATIPEVNAAMIKFGTAAKQANVSVEESVALVEALADKGVKGEIAGTGLKNVLLKLQTGANDTNPKIVGMVQALENLRAKNLSAADVVKMFGQENYSAAKILIENTDRVKQLTTAVTGTSVALDQATINTQNNAAALAQAKNKFQLTAIEMGEKLAPVMTFSTNAFTYFLKAVMTAPEVLQNYGAYILSATGMMIAFNAATVQATISEKAKQAAEFFGTGITKTKATLEAANITRLTVQAALTDLLTGKITLSTAATRIWNATLAANPAMWVIAGISALIGAIKLYDENNAKAKQLQELTNKTINEASAANKSYEKATEELTSKVQSLHNVTKEGREVLQKDIDLKIQQAKATLEHVKAKQLEAGELAKQPSLLQQAWNLIKSGGNAAISATHNTIDAYKNSKEAADAFGEQIKKLESNIQNLSGVKGQLDKALNAESIADKIAGENISQLTEKADLYRKALQIAKIGTEEYERIRKKLAAVDKKLTPAETGTNKEAEKEAEKQAKLTKQAQDKTLTMIENAKKAEEAILIKNYRDGILNKRQFEDQMFENEIYYLSQRLGAKKQFGLDYSAEDLELNKRLLDNQQQLEAEQKKIADENKAKFFQDMEMRFEEEKAAIYQNFANGLITKQEFDFQLDELEANTTAMRLEAKKAFHVAAADDEIAQAQRAIEFKRAQAQAEADLEAIKGDAIISGLGLAKAAFKERSTAWKLAFAAEKVAAISQIVINTMREISGINAAYSLIPGGQLIAAPLTLQAKIRSGIAIGTILAQAIPAFEAGLYDVTSAYDGKHYRAGYSGVARTGEVRTPQLFLAGEKMPEMIIDGPTMRNLKMKSPEIIQAIHQHRVPAYAAGMYPETPTSSGTSEAVLMGLMATINGLNQTLNNGISAEMRYQDYKELDDKVNTVNQEFNI